MDMVISWSHGAIGSLTMGPTMKLYLKIVYRNINVEFRTSPKVVEAQSLLADPGPFRVDEEDPLKRQKEYLSFVALVYLKMEVDDHRFKSARNKIFYVASRPAFTHIPRIICQLHLLQRLQPLDSLSHVSDIDRYFDTPRVSVADTSDSECHKQMCSAFLGMRVVPNKQYGMQKAKD
jgi:hypothetical protein